MKKRILVAIMVLIGGLFAFTALAVSSYTSLSLSMSMAYAVCATMIVDGFVIYKSSDSYKAAIAVIMAILFAVELTIWSFIGGNLSNTNSYFVLGAYACLVFIVNLTIGYLLMKGNRNEILSKATKAVVFIVIACAAVAGITGIVILESKMFSSFYLWVAVKNEALTAKLLTVSLGLTLHGVLADIILGILLVVKGGDQDDSIGIAMKLVTGVTLFTPWITTVVFSTLVTASVAWAFMKHGREDPHIQYAR